MPAFKEGDILAGRFELSEELGTGGMAEVWRARDHGPRPFTKDRVVALKILQARWAKDGEVLARFDREAEEMIGFAHPNIVKVFARESDGATHFLVMEYVEGESLRECITARQNRPMPPADATEIVAGICRGIGYAHAGGVIHRDIKPENVLLAGQYAGGRVPPVKVTDFGIAQVLDGTHLTHPGEAPGTLAYMPAERLRGGEGSVQSDVFACGVVLYELLTGARPFVGKSFSALVEEQEAGPPEHPGKRVAAVSKSLGTATLAALENDLKLRYVAINDMRLAIEAALRGEDVEEYLPTRYLKSSGGRRRSRSRESDGREAAPPHPPPPEKPGWGLFLQYCGVMAVLLVLLEIVVRASSVIDSIPAWVFVAAPAAAIGAFGLRRTALFGPDPAARAVERQNLRGHLDIGARKLTIVALALYWVLLGFHLTDTVRDAIDRQVPESHVWLEAAGALVWILLGLVPLWWLHRRPRRLGRLLAFGVVLVFVWTAAADLMPEAPQKVAPLFWSRRVPLGARIDTQSERLHHLLVRIDARHRSHALAVADQRLRYARAAHVASLRRSAKSAQQRHAHQAASNWLESVRRVADTMRETNCRSQDVRVSVSYRRARAYCVK
jgi:hypothetical protein